MGFLALGFMLIALNLAAEPISDTCSPLLRVTIACITRWPSAVYQYLWLTISVVVMAGGSAMANRWLSYFENNAEHSKRVYACMLSFMRSHDSRNFVISSWKQNVWSDVVTQIGDHKITWSRSFSYAAMFIPLAALVSVPDFAFGMHLVSILVPQAVSDLLVSTVLSRNIPVSGLLGVFSNSVTISILKTAITYSLMPKLSAFLSRIKLGALPRAGLGVLQDQETRALIDLNFGLVHICSPMFCVFLLDESCYRGCVTSV